MPVDIASIQQFNRLAQSTETILLQNNQPGISVYYDPKLEIEAVFEAKDDLNGGDIKEMSAAVLANPTLRGCIQRGIYSIVDASSNDVLTAVQKMVSEWDARSQQRQDAAANLVRQSDRVIAKARMCIAPSGRELCGVPVTGSEETAPLCSQHLNLVNQYTPSTDTAGKTIWQRRT